MIVILRRIKAAAGRVTGTEWLLVAVEGFLVFVGIFAAFQLQEWAEDRRERAHVDRLLERLLAETQLSVTHYDYWAKSAGALAATARRNSRDLIEGRCPARGSLLDVDVRVIDPPSVASLNELVSVVGLSRVPSEDLRRRLSTYDYVHVAFYQQLEKMNERASAEPVLQATDPRLAYEMRDPDPASDSVAPSVALDIHKTNAAAVEDREALCRDEEFKRRYLHAANELQRLAALRMDMLLISYATCFSLAEHLGRECLLPDMRDALGEDRLKLLEERHAIIKLQNANQP